MRNLSAREREETDHFNEKKEDLGFVCSLFNFSTTLCS